MLKTLLAVFFGVALAFPTLTPAQQPDSRLQKWLAIKDKSFQANAVAKTQNLPQQTLGAWKVIKTVPMESIGGGLFDGLTSLGFDGQYLWGIDGTALSSVHYMDKVDRSNGNILQYFQAPNKSAIADGSISLDFTTTTHPWVLNYLDNLLYEVDPSTGKVLSSIHVAGTSVISGLGFDNRHLWYGEWDYGGTNGGAKLRQLNKAGRAINSFRVRGISVIEDITFVRGAMWISGEDTAGNYYFFNVDTTTHAIISKVKRSPCEDGLTFDGQYVWSANWCNKIYTAYKRPALAASLVPVAKTH